MKKSSRSLIGKRFGLKKLIYSLWAFCPLGALAYIPLVHNGPLNSAARSSDIGQFLATVVNWGLGLAISLTVLSIIFGGIQYMTTDALFKKEQGKERIKASVVGLLIALSGWIILNQIDPRILQEKNLALESIKGNRPAPVVIDNGVDLNNPPPASNPQPEKEGAAEDGKIPDDGGTGDSSAVPRDENQMRSDLAAMNVTVNKNPCTYPNQTDCTNVAGFRQSTLDAIKYVNEQLGGSGFVITGGTEHGHSTQKYSHANGYKFDIGQNSNSSKWNQIDSLLKGLTGAGTVENNKIYKTTIPTTGAKIELIRESNGDQTHWDIKALP